MQSYQLPSWVWPLAVIGATALVFWRGDRELRISLGVMVAAWLLSIKAYVYGHDLQQGIFLIDTLVFAWFLWLALHSQRFWPLFAAAFSMLMVMTHIIKAVIPSLDAWTYLSVGILFSYMTLGALAAGAYFTQPVATPSAETLPQPLPAHPVRAAMPAAARQQSPATLGPATPAANTRRRRTTRPVPEPA